VPHRPPTPQRSDHIKNRLNRLDPTASGESRCKDQCTANIERAHFAINNGLADLLNAVAEGVQILLDSILLFVSGPTY
jgi:hypothetical protein